MADTKISALTAYTTGLAADLLPVVDTANTTTKKITLSDFFNVRSDLLTIKDTSDATKKIAFSASGITTATTRTITAPDSNTTLPIISQILTISGPTAARTITVPDANFTVARTDAANTFTGASTASAWVLTSPTITTSIVPTANDGAALGSTTNMFSDLFLASGAVINFNNGDVTLTHSLNTLTLGGGDLALGANSLTMTGSLAATGARVTKGWFTDVESTNMPTVGGTAILTSLTAPQFTTIELGHASDTTLARVSAGVVSIEGVTILTVAGGTLTGSITLGENTSIALDPAGSADGKYTGITVTGTAGYAQTYGDLVYLDPTDSRWEKCDANSAAAADGDSRGIIGIVVVAGAADGNACTILLHGIIRADAAFPTFTVNNPIYVSETAGAVTQTQPTTTDVVIRIVGSAITTDEMYFNPENDWITHT